MAAAADCLRSAITELDRALDALRVEIYTRAALQGVRAILQIELRTLEAHAALWRP